MDSSSLSQLFCEKAISLITELIQIRTSQSSLLNELGKSKESTARITMFHQIKIPFVFTLEASFAGASRGKLQGQHFSLGDLENIGKAVLKALYYTRMAESNRRMLKELAIEAESQQLNEEGGDSDGDGSSSDDNEEEEKNAQAENEKIKKELEEIMAQ